VSECVSVLLSLLFSIKNYEMLSINTNNMQLCNRIYYSKVFFKSQHVSSGTPIIIRSSKLHLHPLVYMVIGRCQGNGRSPYGHINQRLQIQFRAPDDDRCVARNMLSLQKTLE